MGRLLDEDAVINAINALHEKPNAWLDCAVDAVKDLQSFTPPLTWIPITKQVPKENGYYLTSTINKEVYCDYWSYDHFDRTEAVVAWMKLPERMQKGEPMNELIYKQQAIDEISRWLGYLDDDMICRIQMGLRTLPSAQPEHTCVNCGRTVNNGGWYADWRTRCPIEEHYALPKDGYCHLWEKKNVTDDDYPEGRADE